TLKNSLPDYILWPSTKSIFQDCGIVKNRFLRSFIEPPIHDEYEETVLLQETLLASKKRLSEAHWTIEDSPERRFRRLKDLIDAKKAIRNKELSSHNRKSASRLMTS